jgi:hypothetical protein
MYHLELELKHKRRLRCNPMRCIFWFRNFKGDTRQRALRLWEVLVDIDTDDDLPPLIMAMGRKLLRPM